MSYITELIGCKQAGAEQETLPGAGIAFYKSEYERLCGELQNAHEAIRLPDEPCGKHTALLETAYEASHLPELPQSKERLNELLVRLRFGMTAKA
ncbi:MAG: hypothetical protein MSG64_20665 [Pyrinomonadaceae bacterium MAG19_C2-C3]|nr:hypothetical protein [Pyrinomonadaceae bacterium MAG19_C2-C3]